MPTRSRTAVVDADFETAWEFYDGIEELRILTPDWVGLRVQATGPEGGEPDGYLVGTEVEVTTRPLGLFTASEWVVLVTERDVSEGHAYFVDEQVGDCGPFREWRHTHVLVDLGGWTLLHDRVYYRSPLVGALPLAMPLLAAMLRHRHPRTRSLLED